MLSNVHFYHRITRKLVVAFGTMFNNLKMVRYNKAGTTEIERITVPLSYMSKEKYYQRLTQDPNMNNSLQINLPRMTFELLSITYDPLRKVSQFNTLFAPSGNPTTIKTGYVAPYNYNFQLNIFVRNTEDGTQLIEQILPYFNPDYTLTANLVDVGSPLDIPIILDSISYDVSDNVGVGENIRTLVWTLSFTVKAYLFGPISDTSKIIRKSTANTYESSYLETRSRTISLQTDLGFGEYKIGELAFEGLTLETANLSGYVKSWDNTANIIVLTDVTGYTFGPKILYGAVSNSAREISAYLDPDNQLVHISVVPDPINANVTDDFGFTEIFQEYPNIGNFNVADSTVLTSDNFDVTADDNDG